MLARKTIMNTVSVCLAVLLLGLLGCANNKTVLNKRDLLKSAAEKGDAEAQYQLGRSYCCGDGAGYSEARAREWFCKAALQGHGGAQYQLGRMLGERMDSDSTPSKRQFLIEAYMWYSLAAAQNVPLADSERDALATDLSPQELDESEERARVWKSLDCR